MSTNVEGISVSKKYEPYINLVIKIAVLLFAAGQIYNKVSYLEATINVRAASIHTLEIHDATNSLRITNLENELRDIRERSR